MITKDPYPLLIADFQLFLVKKKPGGGLSIHGPRLCDYFPPLFEQWAPPHVPFQHDQSGQIHSSKDGLLLNLGREAPNAVTRKHWLQVSAGNRHFFGLSKRNLHPIRSAQHGRIDRSVGYVILRNTHLIRYVCRSF